MTAAILTFPASRIVRHLPTATARSRRVQSRKGPWSAAEAAVIARIWHRYLTNPIIAAWREDLTDTGDPVISYLDHRGLAVYTVARLGDIYYADAIDTASGATDCVFYEGRSLAALAKAVGV